MAGEKNDPGLDVLRTGDGSVTLLNKVLNATYHSTHGAVQESRHIFIERGLDYAALISGKQLTLLEVGFGTGLNAFLTLQEAASKGYIINYITLEKFPVPAQLFGQLDFAEEKDKSALKKILESEWNTPVVIAPHFTLTKYHTDVNDLVFPENIHLVYYDAFAPAVAPEMWRPEIFERLIKVMPENACLVTFCAQGAFKRLLKQTGFTVEALPGPPGKREMTRAVKLS